MMKGKQERCERCGGRMKRCYVRRQWSVRGKRKSELRPVGWLCQECGTFKSGESST